MNGRFRLRGMIGSHLQRMFRIRPGHRTVATRPYERGSTIVTSNLPFDEWSSTFGSERLTGELLDRLTHDVPSSK